MAESFVSEYPAYAYGEVEIDKDQHLSTGSKSENKTWVSNAHKRINTATSFHI